jgi:hypothetical protein
MKKIEETITNHLKRSPEAIMPTIILRKLILNWQEKLNEKKKDLDTFLKQV